MDLGNFIALDEQLVGENAQAVDRRGFNAKNDRAQRDRATAVAARERQFGGSEIAFRTDQHQNGRGSIAMFGEIFRQDFLEMDGVGLERADQLKIEMPAVLEELRHGLGRVDLRQPVLTALFRRFDRDRLPFRLL